MLVILSGDKPVADYAQHLRNRYCLPPHAVAVMRDVEMGHSLGVSYGR